jgi:hypothetical protein
LQKENAMNIKNKTILITGANRGIGRALVEEGRVGHFSQPRPIISSRTEPRRRGRVHAFDLAGSTSSGACRAFPKVGSGFFHHNQPVSAITDSPPRPMRE